MPKIRIQIRNGGEVKYLPTGFSGGQCHKATEPFEKGLGGEITHEEATPEADVEQLETEPDEKEEEYE